MAKKLKVKIEKSKTLVSAAELAEIWGVTRSHVSRLVHTGRLVEGVQIIGEQLVFDLMKVKYPVSKMVDASYQRDQAVAKAAMGV